MKTIFPLLLCYVLMTAQTFALSGGPVYGGAASVVGTYSGSIMGVTDVNSPDNPAKVSTNSSNAIGLFSLSVPKSASSSGTFILFSDGTVFTGTINAIVDPLVGKITGILQGTYQFTAVNVTDGTSQSLTATAAGSINAQLNLSKSTTANGRLAGTAAIQVSYEVSGTTFEPIIAHSVSFNVSGFRQSTVAAAASTIGTGTGSTGGGSSN